MYTLRFSNGSVSILAENGSVVSRNLSTIPNRPAAMSTNSTKPTYRLDAGQKRVLELSNLNTDSYCHPAPLAGRVVKRQLDEKLATKITGVTIQEADGRLTFANIDVREDDLDMVTRGWIYDGLQTLLREGNDVSLGVRLCGAAGRVIVVESVRASR